MNVDLHFEDVKDWPSFHKTFQNLLGFPGVYGANMDAWIDCMSYLRDKDAEMTRVILAGNELLFIKVSGTEDFMRRCGEIFNSFVVCIAHMNERFLKRGEASAIALIFE